MLQVAFVGTFSATLEPRCARSRGALRHRPGRRAGIVARLPEVDVLVTLVFSPEMGAAAPG